MDQLKGLKSAHVYHDSAYGQEPIAILDKQAAQYGFAVQHLAVQPPGLDQKATWLRVKVSQPDWVILRSTGVMTSTALKEAAQVGVPRDKIVGAAPTCLEQEMVPAGEAAHTGATAARRPAPWRPPGPAVARGGARRSPGAQTAPVARPPVVPSRPGAGAAASAPWRRARRCIGWASRRPLRGRRRHSARGRGATAGSARARQRRGGRERSGGGGALPPPSCPPAAGALG